MMKSILLLLTAVIFQFCALAQPGVEFTTTDKKAVKSFELAREAYQMQKLDLSQLYLEEALDRDNAFLEAHQLLSQVYIEKQDWQKAKETVAHIIEVNPKFFIPNHLILGKLYLDGGDYEKAKSYLTTFLTFRRAPYDLIMDAEWNLKNIDYALAHINSPVPFEPINVGEAINTSANEYYPTITADNNTFLFTRDVALKDAYGGHHEDFFVSNKEDGDWTTSIPLHQVNTRMNEGAPSLSADGQVLLYTACDLFGEYGGGRQGNGSCDLFYCQRSGNNWSKPYNLGKAINTGHWESQPSYSADGKTIYFVRGVSKGSSISKQDIYYSELGADGYWTKAQPLSDVINTSHEEESVMIHPDGKTLYFSSNGHLGFGGLDIFMSRKDENGAWSTPVNLGYPINTYNDENSLLVSSDGDLAYFASDREGGFGGLDLYSFELYDGVRPGAITYTTGKVFDKETKEPLEAYFELIDLNTGKQYAQSYSDASDGTFLVTLPIDKDYALKVEREGYLFYSENFSLKGLKMAEPFDLLIPLTPVKVGGEVVLNNIFFETNKYELLATSNVELKVLLDFLNGNENLKIEIQGHTDNVGTDAYNQGLSEKRAMSVYNYLIEKGMPANRLTFKGYGADLPIATNDTEEGRSKNRRTQFKITAD